MGNIRISLVVLAALAVTGQCYADVQVALKMEHKSLVRYEPVNAFVTLINDSDDLVILGTDKGLAYDKLDFVVKYGKDDFGMKPVNSNSVIGKIKLMPDDKREELIELSSFYDFTKMGSYVISVVIDIKGRKYESNRVAIDIVGGIELTSVSRNLPDASGASRKYALRYWQREGDNYLFMLVENEQTKQIVSVFNLGPFMRIPKPTLTVDRQGNITVVHQKEPDFFVKSLFKASEEQITFVDSINQNQDGVPYVATTVPAPVVAPPVAEPKAVEAKP